MQTLHSMQFSVIIVAIIDVEIVVIATVSRLIFRK